MRGRNVEVKEDQDHEVDDYPNGMRKGLGYVGLESQTQKGVKNHERERLTWKAQGRRRLDPKLRDGRKVMTRWA